MADPPSGQELAAAIRRVYHLLMFRLDSAVSGAFMSFAQYEVLALVERDPSVHAAAVARELRVTRQTTHGLIRQLLRAHLVELLPTDGGVRGIRLTPAGKDRLDLARGGQVRSKAGWYREWD